MQHLTLPSLFGYDRAILERLPEAQQKHIERVAEVWLLSCVLLASPLGYAAWLVEHSVWLAVLVALGTLLLVLNMLRLTAAGGGVSPHMDRALVASYRPGLSTSVMLFMLACLLAQPAQLPLWKTELDAPVAVHRQTLVEQHARAVAALGFAADPGYERALARCDFVVLRLQRMWRQPTRALQLSAFYVFLVLLPTLWARFVALDALRAYELSRWQLSRRVVLDADRASGVEVDRNLRRFPSYAPEESPFADPPFNTRVRNPLLMPALPQPVVARARNRALRPRAAKRGFLRWRSKR